MNWKKILRSTMCLVVVLAILLNCIPVKADAVAGAVIAGKIAVDALKIVTAILIGLGVTAGISNADWESLRVRTVAALQDQGFIDSEGKFHIFTTEGTDFLFSVSGDAISAVRSLLYSEGYLQSDSVVNANGFSATNLHSGYLLHTYFQMAAKTWPAEFVSCLSSLGVNDKMMILAMSDSLVYGYHFDADGRFVLSRFRNPLGTANASLIGVHPISDFSLYTSYGNITTCSSGSTTYGIFYSKHYAEKFSNFLTSRIAAFDFTGLPYYGVYDSLYQNSSIYFRFYWKNSTSSSWDALSNLPVSPSGLGTDSGLYAVYWDNIIWNSNIEYTISSPYDFTLENVAPEEQVMVDAYPEWSSGAITVPGSDVGSEDDQVILYPLGLGNSLSDTESLSQSDVWTGSNVSSNTSTNTGINSDSIANVGATTFWDTLSNTIASIFVPSEDYLSSKVDALAAEFGFIGPVVTAARSIVLPFNDFEPEPPVIYLHLEDTRGSYDLGGTVPFIDMTWYAEYKPIGDALLSSLLWVVFVWRLFRQLPGLIAGLPGDFVYDSLQGLHINLPSRSMDREVQKVKTRMEIAKNAKKGAGK